MYSDFEYVLERKTPHPIFFGSKIHRDTSPIIKGTNLPNIGPGLYNLQKPNQKVYSVKGFGGFCSEDQRWKELGHFHTPSPTKYAHMKKWGLLKESYKPFGSDADRFYIKEKHIPGPGTYDIRKKKCRKIKFQYNLGKPEMVPIMDTICDPFSSDYCSKCGDMCEYNYWHRNHEIYLCHICWLEEKFTAEIYNEKELKQFKKIRTCSFFHTHEKTVAAIKLITPKQLWKRIVMENYLDLFINC